MKPSIQKQLPGMLTPIPRLSSLQPEPEGINAHSLSKM
jgi:hypothetical protein